MCSAPGDDDGPRVVAAVREEERTLRAGDGAPLREFVAQPATGFRRGAVVIIHDVWVIPTSTRTSPAGSPAGGTRRCWWISSVARVIYRSRCGRRKRRVASRRAS